MRDPYAPPVARLEDPVEVRTISRPRAVVAAVWVFVLVLTISILNVVPQVRLESTGDLFALVVASLVVVFGATLILMIWKGRNWARFAGLGCTALFMLVTSTASNWHPWRELSFVVAMMLDGVGLLLIFVPGRAWFKRRD